MKLNGKILVRTVTMAHIGEVESVDDRFIHFSSGGWLAESDRFGVTLATGKVREFEPAPGSFAVALASIVDVWPWGHEIPTKAIP